LAARQRLLLTLARTHLTIATKLTWLSKADCLWHALAISHLSHALATHLAHLQHHFHDDGTNIPYDGVGITFEADQVVNRAAVQILGNNTLEVADDAASQTKYFIQTTSITGSLLHNDTAAQALATYLLNPEPEARYTSLTTNLNKLTNAQRDTVAIIDIGDTISIEKTFASGAGTTQLAQELAVEGVEHSITVGGGHRVEYFTSPTVLVFELILDDAIYGIIDSTNVLG
jgi:hypothetical protein